MKSKKRHKSLEKTILWLKKGFRSAARFFREEDLLKIVMNSFRHDLLASEKLMVGLIVATILVFPIVTGIVNLLGNHYQTPSTAGLIGLFPGCLAIFFLCVKTRAKYRYTGSVLTIFFATLTSFFAMAAGATCLLSTPFGANDLSHALLRIDQLIGFNQAAWMNWRSHYPALTNWLSDSYGSITLQVAFTATLLALLRCTKSARLYILTIMIGILIAYCIYYFWPTFAPAYVIHHVRFPIEAAQLIERTIRIREYLPYELYPGAGLIAFPSCHVIMGLSSIFSFFYAYQETKQRALKRIFIVIAVGSFLLNLSLIASTVLLGYHYLVDVIASLVIFLVTWYWMVYLARNESH